MTWTRLDDTWGDDSVFDTLDHQTRWHYLMMIQVCSRGERYDGTMRLAKARQCSDVDDATGCIAALVAAGLVENVDGATLRIVRIDDHLPPKYLRDPERKEKQRDRKRQQRAVAKGVTRDIRSDRSSDGSDPAGQDRTGRGGKEVPENTLSEDEQEMLDGIDRSDEWAETFPEDAA